MKVTLTTTKTVDVAMTGAEVKAMRRLSLGLWRNEDGNVSLASIKLGKDVLVGAGYHYLGSAWTFCPLCISPDDLFDDGVYHLVDGQTVAG